MLAPTLARVLAAFSAAANKGHRAWAATTAARTWNCIIFPCMGVKSPSNHRAEHPAPSRTTPPQGGGLWENAEESSDAEARDQDMTRAFAQLSDSYRRRHAERRAASTRKTALFNGTLNLFIVVIWLRDLGVRVYRNGLVLLSNSQPLPGRNFSQRRAHLLVIL